MQVSPVCGRLLPFQAPSPAVSLEGALQAVDQVSLASGVEVHAAWKHDARDYGSSFAWTPSGLIVLGGETSFVRLDAGGTPRQTADPGHFFGEPPAPRPDGGFYASQVSSLEAYDAAGELLWRQSPSQGLSTVTVSGPEGNCYVADHQTFYAFAPNGSPLWSKPVQPAWDQSRPAVDDRGNVYLPARDGSIYAWAPDGRELWRYQGLVQPRTDSFFFSPLKTDLAVGPDGTVYAGAEDGQLHAVRQGVELWARPLGAPRLERYDTPAVDGQGRVYASNQESVIAFDPQGNELWRKSLGPTLHLTPDPHGGVLLGIRGGPLHGLAPDGRVRWTLTDGNTYARPVFDPEGDLFTSTSGRYIVSLRPPADSTLHEALARAAQVPPPASLLVETPRGLVVGGVSLHRRGGPGSEKAETNPSG